MSLARLSLCYHSTLTQVADFQEPPPSTLSNAYKIFWRYTSTFSLNTTDKIWIVSTVTRHRPVQVVLCNEASRCLAVQHASGSEMRRRDPDDKHSMCLRICSLACLNAWFQIYTLFPSQRLVQPKYSARKRWSLTHYTSWPCRYSFLRVISLLVGLVEARDGDRVLGFPVWCNAWLSQSEAWRNKLVFLVCLFVVTVLVYSANWCSKCHSLAVTHMVKFTLLCLKVD